MHKNFKLFAVLIGLFFVIGFYAGCLESEEELGPSIKSIKNAGKIVVGTSAPYEPMEYFDDQGNIIGFDIDLANEIASSLGVELEIKNLDFNMSIFENELNKGGVDVVIAALSINTERSGKVLFSTPYLNAGQVIIVRSDDDEIHSPEDLENKKVGVQNGTTSEDEAELYTNSSLVIGYSEYSTALYHLLSGNISAIVIDYPAGFGLVKNNDDIKIVGSPFTNELYGVAMKKGNTDLKDKVDSTIVSGVLSNLEDKWF